MVPVVATPAPLSELGFHRVTVPLRVPHRGATTSEAQRDVVLVSITLGDGTVGWAECASLSDPFYAGETTDDVWRVALDQVGPAFMSMPLWRAMPMEVPSPALASALVDARRDAELRAAGEPWRPAIGLSARHTPMCLVVGLAVSVPVPGAQLPPGVTMVKLKVTPLTLDRITAVREAWPEIPLAIDANESFSTAEDLPLGLLSELAYVEQPFARTDLAAHAELRKRGVRVALDESVHDLAAVRRALGADACDVVSVKPGLVGGADAAIEIARLVRSRGGSCFVGGMLELGVGRLAAARVAASEFFDLPTDLGPSNRYVEHDIAEPSTSDHLGLIVDDGPGLAAPPFPDRLAAVRTGVAVFRSD